MDSKILFLVCSIIGVTMAMRMPKFTDILENKTDIIHCEGTKVIGGEDLAELFLPLVLECQIKIGSMDLEKMATCVMARMGLIDQDGAPNVAAMDSLVERVFSDEILDRLAGFKQDLHRCGEEFAYSYNSVAESAHHHRSMPMFIGCLKQVLTHYGDSIETACASVSTSTGSTDED